MAKMKLRYGSEWQLLRLMGRHRNRLDAAVRKAVRADEIRWKDFRTTDDPVWRDAEWKGLDFLPKSNRARREWEKLWPQTGNVQNWDALGKVTVDGEEKWLLVEAKAHLDEIKSSCGAKSKESRAQIEEFFRVVKEALGVPEDADWMKPYYQYCNRLAMLEFLNTTGVPSRLLMIYFVGDWCGSSKRKCPDSAAGWKDALAEQNRHIGLPRRHPLSGRVHKLFLEV